MLRVQILCVGKLKERWMQDGCAEYLKRMAGFCRVSVTETAECRLSERPSAAQIAAALEEEGSALLAKIPAGAMTVALCIEGVRMTSPELSTLLENAAGTGKSTVCFVIGSSHGLAERVKSAAQVKLSMSDMTFPHQLARLMLCEQIYRAFQISAGGKYHK